MNRHMLTLIVCISSYTLSAQQETSFRYTPKATAIVFDVDGVILQRTIPVRALVLEHLGELLKALFDRKLIHEVAQLYSKTAPVGAYISLFEHMRPSLVPFARALASTRVLIPETVCIIEALLAQGYQVHIGTNETPNEFAIHKERFPVFSQFTTYTFADYSQAPKNIVQKPQKRYFDTMKERILTKNKHITHFIFIDDRLVNVQGAEKAGYIGIHFTIPDALQTALAGMGIMQPVCPQTILPAGTVL